MIAHIEWHGGAGHFIVVQFVHDKMLVRDPDRGQVVSTENNGTYPPGVLTGWLIKCT